MERRAAAFARLFEAVHEGVYIGTIGPESTTTIVANSHLKLIFGYAAEAPESEVRPFDADRFVDPQARAALLGRLLTDGSVGDYLLRLRRADSSAVWVELTARADERAADDTIRVEALIRDVSERKKLDDQKRDIFQQLLQAEKMAALGQTVSGVAHELNNPLATILSWAERLSQRATLDEPVRRGLETILAESERAARIVRNLLTFARKRHTTRTMVDINQVVRETLALRAYEQRVTNITVIDALAAGIPQIFADPHQVQQVLLNLIINAEQAMLTANGRGTVVVRTWQDMDRESIVLEVNDDGPGVPEEVKTKIFDPFFTTKDVGKGTGLGLTVAYAIVQEHGGRLWLESSATRGASFYIELPATGGKLRPATGPPASGNWQANGGGSGSGGAGSAVSQIHPPLVSLGGTGGALPRLDSQAILIVEDETALATAMAETLTDAGYLVDRAGDGEEALRCLDGGHYDLIISDLKMPHMDGIQFFGALTQQFPAMATRIIFVTGDVIGTDAERFLGESGCRWLAKPFRLNELLRIATDVIGHRPPG